MSGSMREAMAEALEDVKGVDAEEVLEATEEEGVEPEAEDKESEDIADLLEGELKKMRGGSEDSSEANTSVAEEESSETEDSPAEDEDEDAFVANLSERAQARFRELADRARQAEESAAQIKQSGEELYRIMSESGVTPNDLTAYFEYYKAINGGDASEAERWYAQLENTHSQRTGRRVGNADPLNNHPDLKQKVEDLEMTEEGARELASLRDYANRQNEFEQRQAEFNAQYGEQQRQQQEAAQYANRSAMELDKWSSEMQAKDSQFSQKEALLLERAQEVFPTLHPAHWPEWVANEYAYISKAFPAPEKKKPAPNTIRPGVSGKASKAEAGSIAEALEEALREMRG